MDQEVTVMAQGTFDIIHPGHIDYLEKSSQLGDKLIVIVSRDSRLDRKLALNEKERKEVLQNLEMTDQVILGSEEDIFETLELVKPDTITLGHDQDHNKEYVKKMAEETLQRPVKVKRIKSTKETLSSSKIKERLIQQKEN